MEKNIIKKQNNKPSYVDIFDPFFNFPTFLNGFPTFEKLDQINVNVKETDKSYQVQLVAPGYKKENFNIDVEDDVMIISNKIEDDVTEEGENWSRREFKKSSFKRSFKLSENLDVEKIEASYQDGILYVDIPKQEIPKKEPKKIKVK